MDGLLLASISFLCTLFCIIIGFIVKLWFDERNAVQRNELLKQSLNSKPFKRYDQSRDESHYKESRESGKTDERIPDDNGDFISFYKETTNKKATNAQVREDGNDDDYTTEKNTPDDIETEKKMGKKKMAKLQAKAEAKIQREQQQAEREEKKRRENELAKQLEEKRILDEQEEQKRLEIIRLEREEREKHELEEYLKLKETFDVEEHGFDNENEELESANFSEQFISFIQKKKVVHVDELASNFRIKIEDVVERLTKLLQEKSITGVFDDRGLFVHVNKAELQNVAKFINQRGRIKLSELAENSNKFINLMPVD